MLQHDDNTHTVMCLRPSHPHRQVHSRRAGLSVGGAYKDHPGHSDLAKSVCGLWLGVDAVVLVNVNMQSICFSRGYKQNRSHLWSWGSNSVCFAVLQTRAVWRAAVHRAVSCPLPSVQEGKKKKKSKKSKNLLMFKFLWNGKSSNFEFRKSCCQVLHLDWNFVFVPHLAGCLKTEARTALPGSSVLVNRLWSWFLCLVFSILHSEWFCCTLESTVLCLYSCSVWLY